MPTLDLMKKRLAQEDTLRFGQAVRARRSYRDFLPTPLPDGVIRAVLEDAQFAPSNCNTQPWNTHVVSGETLNDLSRALHEAYDTGRMSPDFTFDDKAYLGSYGDRRREHGKVYYGSLGVSREDTEGRRKAGAKNFSFYNAPHVALLFMPVIGDSVRVAGDIGMYGQTMLLSLTSRGLGGIPQTVLGLFADTIRQTLGISNDLKLLFGISFGYPNVNAPANSSRVGREPIATSVTFHD